MVCFQMPLKHTYFVLALAASAALNGLTGLPGKKSHIIVKNSIILIDLSPSFTPLLTFPKIELKTR